jgi:two-component system chemotaxis sensor kinase CheA
VNDFTHQDLLAVFLAECEENLSTLDELLVVLETSGDAETIATIFRSAHTLKGNCGTLGYQAPTRVAHFMEDLLARLRSGEIGVTSELVSLLLRGTDALRELLPRAIHGNDVLDEAAEQLIRDFVLYRGDATATLLTTKPAAPPAIPQKAVSEEAVKPAEPAPQETAAAAPPRNAMRRIRVELAKLDRLLNTAGEIVIGSGRARVIAEALPAGAAREALLESLEETERLFAEMQEQITRVRMVPVGATFEQHKRTVRDVAQSVGREVRLVIEGADVEVDASVIENIKDPLTHMIRNAVDHGIENADVRVRAGKDPVGTITLSARHEGAAIVIELKDDGAGLSRKNIIARAQERGIIGPNEIPADDEVFHLIFLPGFSTATTVSDLSGRGVGMDVVSRNVASLRGTIEINSIEGTGTTFSIHLPLTLAILDGMTVEAGGERFVLPLHSIEECISLPESLRDGCVTGVLDFRGSALPFVRLAQFYRLDSIPAAHENVVIMRNGKQLVGLVADALVGEMKVVIKPVGKLFRNVPGVTGSTLFGDGRVGLIVDVATILKEVVRRESAVAA